MVLILAYLIILTKSKEFENFFANWNESIYFEQHCASGGFNFMKLLPMTDIFYEKNLYSICVIGMRGGLLEGQLEMQSAQHSVVSGEPCGHQWSRRCDDARLR